jgi:peptidoglycan/xylan/chitin deacetylase (PgdA/CDA1 family)
MFINTIHAAYDHCIDNKHISLTFDDGPNVNTLPIINILNKYKITGTFFINGLNVIRNNHQELIKSIYNNGHILGSHGFSHAAMEKLNYFNQLRELYDNELIFRQLLNKRPYYYRPPYFSYDVNIVNMCNMFGYEIITSNLNTNDWNASTIDEIYNNFVTGLSNGAGVITLQHDYQLFNDEALNKMIDYGLAQGYTFVPLDICIGVNKNYNDDNTYGPNLLNGI